MLHPKTLFGGEIRALIWMANDMPYCRYTTKTHEWDSNDTMVDTEEFFS